MMKIQTLTIAATATLAVGVSLAACGTTHAVTGAAQTKLLPKVTVTQTKSAAPAPRITVTHTQTAAPAPVLAAPTPAPAPAPALTNASAVVQQFYEDITNGDYADAWALGGDNIAAQNAQIYASWVAGYRTTASVTLGTVSQWNSTTVATSLIATQDDGTVKTYEGTYTVIAGVITSADITQTS